MTKEEMIALMAEKSGISKKQAGEALGAFMTGVTNQLKKGQKVSFAGFGTFTVSKRKARSGRNPQTGATIQIPATKVPVFKAGKNLKTAVKK
ncbi:MAG TPA: HU family DNA-binding protein [candidate division Zixibacteria bacterium]|nr:HU family DNA-binding protein [candidate division Zixibacteria bacterium]